MGPGQALRAFRDDKRRGLCGGVYVTSSPRLRALYESAGARFVELPVLHPADPFLETAGEDIRRRMFVTEGPQGERLALRPDFTIPVCLEHLRYGDGAGRYAYEGLVFRRHDQGAPERLETGVEDIGSADRPAADAEMLALAIACAAQVSGRPLSVRLGDIGVFGALLRALGLPGRWRRRLRRSFGVPDVMATNTERMVAPSEAEVGRLDPDVRAAAERGRDGLVALLDERRGAHGHSEAAGRSSAEIADRFFEQRALPDAAIAHRAAKVLGDYFALEAEFSAAGKTLRAFAADNGLDLGEALALFEARAAAIAALAPNTAVRFEARFGRPLDYYTGLVFDIRAEGAAAPLVGGGRYDRLMEMLGAKTPIPAVGFTLRLDLADREDGA
jgi:ATP phosphoribosyltransferase regulatory subunit